jgi:hypothetical protein
MKFRISNTVYVINLFLFFVIEIEGMNKQITSTSLYLTYHLMLVPGKPLCIKKRDKYLEMCWPVDDKKYTTDFSMLVPIELSCATILSSYPLIKGKQPNWDQLIHLQQHGKINLIQLYSDREVYRRRPFSDNELQQVKREASSSYPLTIQSFTLPCHIPWQWICNSKVGDVIAVTVSQCTWRVNFIIADGYYPDEAFEHVKTMYLKHFSSSFLNKVRKKVPLVDYNKDDEDDADRELSDDDSREEDNNDLCGDEEDTSDMEESDSETD